MEDIRITINDNLEIDIYNFNTEITVKIDFD